MTQLGIDREQRKGRGTISGRKLTIRNRMSGGKIGVDKQTRQILRLAPKTHCATAPSDFAASSREQFAGGKHPPQQQGKKGSEIERARLSKKTTL